MSEKVDYSSLVQMSDECKNHFKKLLDSGSIREENGNYYGSTKGDPFGETPLSVIQIVEWVAFNYAATLYRNKTNE